ncbi:hypothetical protein HYV83_02065 [Candidatus Woesearchaeota archaeon]|nr:hypothetical protein [Candidatus Woesearchaeota archaeon]
MRKTADFIATAAVNSGIAKIEIYLPSMHEALAHLELFHISLIVAPSYGAYTWPNSELRAFANSIAEVGIEMKYQAELNGKVNRIGNGHQAASPQTQQLGVTGAALVQLAQKLREFAATTYLFSEDLTRPFVSGWHSLKHSEAILNELVTEALSARAIRGHGQQTDTLARLIVEYRANNTT